MSSRGAFAEVLKKHLTDWVQQPKQRFRTDGKHGWVLAKSEAHKNFFDPNWARFVKGSEHTWGHALNSSQAFAVNLFAPAATSAAGALALWNALNRAGGTESPKQVEILFEFSTPTDDSFPRESLGERQQATQIDVALSAEFSGNKTRYFLVEVKLGENQFGSCRGAKEAAVRCSNLSKVLENPAKECWLVETEGRKYWPVIQSGPHPLNFGAIATEGCPWRGGLYQIMRNWAMGQVLVAGGHAADFQVGVCVHLSNIGVMRLKKAVAGDSDAISAFNALLPGRQVSRVEPDNVTEALAPFAPEGWKTYMQHRYMLGNRQDDSQR